MKKKLLTLALAASLVMSFAACGSNGNSSADNSSSSATQSSTAQSSAASTESSSQAEDDAMTLADWLETDEAKQAESATNSALASTGMSVKLAADGDVFIYEYTLPDSDVYAGLSADDLATSFDPVIEANKSQLVSLFETFESEYGIKLSGARFTFLAADGTEIYSGDVANE